MATDYGAEIMESISEFTLQHLPRGWTDSIWNSNFNDTEPLGDDILEETMEADSLPRVLSTCSSKCRCYVMSGKETTFWTDLADSGQLRPFIAYLYYLIDCSQKKAASNDVKRNGILAADAYVSLCAIKGGNAYNVFNANLFQRSVDSLKTIGQQQQRQCSPPARGRGRGRGRGGRGRANAVRSFQSSSVGSDSDESSHEIDQEELGTLIRNFLKTIWLFVGHYSLVHHGECVESLSRSLCQVLSITSSGNDSTVRAEADYDLSNRSPAGLSFAILHKLFATDNNDHVEVVARYVFKHLLPHLLMVTADGRHVASSTIPVSLVQLRDLTTNFVLDLLRDNPEGVAKSVYVILQHLCAKVTDKADYRTKVSQIIITLVLALPTETFQLFLEWLQRFSKNPKVGYRAFAVDVVQLLFSKTFAKMANADEAGQEDAKKLLDLCLRLIIGRCSDKAPSVRNRALNCLTQIMNDTAKRLGSINEDESDDLVQQLLCDFVTGVSNGIASNEEDAAAGGTENDGGNVAAGEEMEQNGDAPAPEVNSASSVTTPTGLAYTIKLLPLLLKRCNDEKTQVRKAAVEALECLAIIVPPCLNEEAISILRYRCMDTATSVRRQALESMTTLLLKRNDDTLEKAWLSDVLALIVDRECTVQEKSVDAFRVAITDNLVVGGEAGERAWRLVRLITLDGTTTRYARRIFQHSRHKDSIPTALLGLVEREAMSESRSSAAWFLLSELVQHSPRFKVNRLRDVWENGTLTGNVFNYAVRILAVKAKELSDTSLTYFAMDLKRQLENFALPSENIADAMKTLMTFTSTDRIRRLDDWCQIIGDRCADYLSQIVFVAGDEEGNTSLSQRNEDDIVRRLFMLGELFQICPQATVNTRNFHMMVAFVASDKYAEFVTGLGSSLQLSQGELPASQQAVSEPMRINMGVSASIRSHAVAALGKLCLQDETLAKKTVAILVVELDTATDSTIRNNIIVILSDLCLRYTSLIDRHIGRISRRLRDSSPLVRKQTLTLMTNLLKEDYLKWRGALLFRFLTGLLDSDPQIRAFAEFCLINILKQRQPTMLYLHFLECLFYFNDARHPSWCSSVDLEIGDERKEEFALSGKDNRKRRLYLYGFMLNQFNDEQRFNTTTRICQEILGAVVDEVVPFDAVSAEVITDSLLVLASKEIKLVCLSPTASAATADDLEEPDPAALGLVENAKKAISQKVKQDAIEHMIPTIVSLKHFLQRKKQTGLNNLLRMYLLELAKDYKNEMKEILANDKILFSEIEYDLKHQGNNANNDLQAPIQLISPLG